MATEVATLIARLRAETGEYVAGIDQAVAANSSLAASHAKTMAVAKNVGESMSKYVTLPIVAAGAIAVKMSMDFDSAFAHVATASKLPDAAIQSLKKSVLSLAESTAQSPTKLAETLVGIERSGVGAKNAMGVLTVAAKLNATGLADQASAASTLTAVMNAYGPAVISAAQAGDTLAKGAEISGLSIDAMSTSLGRTIPAAAALGVSFNDLVTAEAVMAKQGLSAASSGMSLFRILSSIENPTSKGTAAMKALGLSIADAKGMIANGDFIGLLEKIGARSAGNAQAVLQLTGGIRGASGAFAAFAKGGKELADVEQQMAERNHALDEALQKVQQTAGFQLKQAFVAIEVALIQWGAAFAPVVKGLADVIKFGADTIGFLGDMNPVLKDVAVGFLAIAAAIGPTLLIANGLYKAWVNLSAGATHLAEMIRARGAADAEAAGEAEAGIAVTTEAAAAAEARAASETQLTLALDARNAAMAQGVLPGMAGVAGTDTMAAVDSGAATSALVAPTGFFAGVGAKIGAMGAGAAEGTAAIAGATGAMAMFAGAVIPAIAVGVIMQKSFHDQGAAARAQADDLKTLTKAMLDYGSATPKEQQKTLDEIDQRVDHLASNMKKLSTIKFDPNQQGNTSLLPPSENFGLKASPELENVHKSMIELIKTQGALAAQEPFARLKADMAQIPGGLALFNTEFAHMGSVIANAMATAHAKVIAFGAGVGATGPQAETALAQYDAAMSQATGITDETKAAGERAAVALAGIGVSAQYAASATVNGMSTAQIAVAGLMASVDAMSSAAQAGDSYQSAIDAMNHPTSKSFGGGGAGKTSQEQEVDHTSKLATLRDAQLAVARSADVEKAADLSLQQAVVQHKEALLSLTQAQLTYKETLHGVAAVQGQTSEAALAYLEKAKRATLDLAQAQNDQVSATLAQNDAQRSLQHAQNDKPLAALNVRAAQTQLSNDQQDYADPDTILKDQIALRDAQIDLSGANDTVKKAQVDVSNSQIAGKQKVLDLNDVTKIYNTTIHGYAKNSIEAKQAQDQLTDAQIAAATSAQGIVTAQQGIVDASNGAYDATNNLKRAQYDLAGQLTTTGTNAGGFHDKVLDVRTATHQAETATKDYATRIANLFFDPKTNPIKWKDAFVNALTNLQTTMAPSSPLFQYTQGLIDLFGKLLDPTKIANAAPPPPKILHDASGNVTGVKHGPVTVSAHGRIATHAMSSIIGEAGIEAVVPLGMDSTARMDRARIMGQAAQYAPDIVGGGAGGGGSDNGGGGSVYNDNRVFAPVIHAIDANDVEQRVIAAMQNHTDKNGAIPGVRVSG